jgi:nifR3 family TIM-barrel protein
MRIGTLELSSPVLAAPLAGYSDSPMRVLARRHGAAMVFSEMIKAAAVVRTNRKTLTMARFSDAERPVALQLAGREPDETAEAARIIEEFQPDAIDFNAGCPTKKIVREGNGAALLKEPLRVGRILRAMRKAVSVPVTVKLRLGWDERDMAGLEIARIAEAEGAACVIVHGRTAAQKFRGSCDLAGIAAVAEAVSIPVIGNGDVRSGADAVRMMRETGCAGVMIGRRSVGNPWIFCEVRSALAGVPAEERSLSELRSVIEDHYELIVKRYGEESGTRIMRKHAAAYIKGLPENKQYKSLVMRVSNRAEFGALVEEMFRFWTACITK